MTRKVAMPFVKANKKEILRACAAYRAALLNNSFIVPENICRAERRLWTDKKARTQIAFEKAQTALHHILQREEALTEAGSLEEGSTEAAGGAILLFDKEGKVII